jgi:hypothetical protein
LASRSQKPLHDLARIRQYVCDRSDSQLAKLRSAFVAAGSAHIKTMDNKFAECDEQQSGQRFGASAVNVIEMSSSAYEALCVSPVLEPFAGLGAVVGTSAGAGSGMTPSRDNYGAVSGSANIPMPVFGAGVLSPYAGLDQKSSQGVTGQSPVVIDGLAVAGIPSLDLLENNRHNRDGIGARPFGRAKFCGRWSVQGINPKTGQKAYRRINCGAWSCSYCGPRKARTARASIKTYAGALGLKYFLTLTVDPKKLANSRAAVPHLRKVFNKFRFYLKRKFGTAPHYICVLEFTKAGLPHLHILLDRYIPQKWISHVWALLGGGRIVYMKRVTVHNVARYLSKYLTKELFLSAPRGTRRITTARSIKLFPKFKSEIAWELVQSSIWKLREGFRMEVYESKPDEALFSAVEVDEFKFLKAFELIPGVTALN